MSQKIRLRLKTCFKRIASVTFVTSALLSVPLQEGQANVGEAFGFGSRTMALGGIGVAGGTGAFSTYHNPASLSLRSDDTVKDGTSKRLAVSYGILWMNPNFLPISNVVTSNTFNDDKTVYGNIDTTYRATLGQQLGLSYVILPETYRLTVGLTTFLPLEQLAYFDTGEAYRPEYVLYRARTQRPQVALGLGADLGKGFHVGAGLNLTFAVTANATAFITKKNNTASSLKFTTSAKPKASPYLGFLYNNPESLPISLGAVLRFPSTSSMDMKLNSSARLLAGDTNGTGYPALDINFSGNAALFYDPWTLELGGSWEPIDPVRIYTQVDWQIWNQFQSPSPSITRSSSSSFDYQAGPPPSFPYRNIVIPRVGFEFDLSHNVALRLGYAYRQSFLASVSNDVGNYLDPSKHIYNLGLGLSFDRFLNFETPAQLDFNVSYHSLVTQTITKTPGNEAGVASDFKVGAPGYQAGGNLLGGGITLSLAI